MTTADNSPVRQYEHRQATRDSIATQETAVNLEDAPGMAEFEYPVRTDPENTQWPWLKWQDKAEVPTAYGGGLYLQEKISPARIVSTLLKDPAAQQRNWFADFNNLPPDAHYEPYVHHSGKWSNRLIRGSSQRIMCSLLENETMKGQVDLVYMDPPYNIKFNSNFQLTVDDTEVDDNWDRAPKSIREVTAFRDTYRNGTHSYLSQLRINALLAKDLLKESGSFVLQIGPDNLHYAACLLDEVFGHENHVATIPYITSTNSSTRLLPEVGNWLIWFAKSKPAIKYRQLYENLDLKSRVSHMAYDAMCETPEGTYRTPTQQERDNPKSAPKRTRFFRRMPLLSAKHSLTGRSDTYYHHPDDEPCPNAGWSNAERKRLSSQPHRDHRCDTSCDQPVPENWHEHICSLQCHTKAGTRLCPKGRKCGPKCNSNAYPCPTGKHWSVSLAGLHSIAVQNRLVLTNKDAITFKRYAEEHAGSMLIGNWTNLSAPQNKRFVVETPPSVLERILLMTTDPGDLVVDPTCGSGAMPYQCERWGRRWIAIDVSSISLAIARERIATAIHPYHLLKDSLEGHRTDHEREQALKPERERIPFQPKPHYSHDPGFGFVNERQLRMSAKTLAYGRDYNDPKNVIRHQERTIQAKGHKRVSSTFTVESDLPTAQSAHTLENDQYRSRDDAATVRKNLVAALQTSGIHVAGRKDPYLVHDLEETVELPGITHKGKITNPETGEKGSALFYLCQEDEIASDRAARNIAAKARNREDRYAVVIGFDHQGNLNAIARDQGRDMTLLVADAARDLSLTEVANRTNDRRFVVISEPEYQIHQETNSQVSIAITGLVCYNPQSGVVEQTDDRKIAAILTDTDYDQQSFRAVLFNLPNAEEKNLKELRDAFKRDIDPEKWERMKSPRTLPFDLPVKDGNVAVKVIDNTGVEHLFVLTDKDFP